MIVQGAAAWHRMRMIFVTASCTKHDTKDEKEAGARAKVFGWLIHSCASAAAKKSKPMTKLLRRLRLLAVKNQQRQARSKEA